MADSKLLHKNVLVIGYGVAGSKVVADLAKNKLLKVTVLHALDYMEMPFLMTHVAATGTEEHNKALHPVLHEANVEYINAVATSLGPDSCTISSGQVINFDICVVTTGQKYATFFPDPSTEFKLEDRKAFISNFQSQIKQASTIVISGGGPIGVELAADIKIRNKEKKVVLVHPQKFVLDKMTAPFPSIATNTLKTQGVELILNDRVVSQVDDVVTLKSGDKITCDLYIPTNPTGGSNGSFLPTQCLDGKGYIMVNHFLQVEGRPKVFAMGDCSNRDGKGVVKILDQLPILLKNVVALAQEKPLTPHVLGKSFPMGKINGPIFVAIGHHHPDAFGIGPDMPQPLRCCCWCCCCGPPCHTPASKGIAKFKAEFNDSMSPKAGKGIER